MVDEHCTFFPVTRSFVPASLRAKGDVLIAGKYEPVPLWLVIEWDSRKVLVGYHWEGQEGYRTGHRGMAGLEYWRNVRAMLTPQVCEGNSLSVGQEHQIILDKARLAQQMLDEEDEVTEETKTAILKLLGLTDEDFPIPTFR